MLLFITTLEMRNELMKILNSLKQWSLFEKTLLLIFTLINVYLYFAWGDTTIGLIASLSGMLCVVLTAFAIEKIASPVHLQEPLNVATRK